MANQVNSASYYLQKGYIDARDVDCCVRLIEEAANMCGATYASQQATAQIKLMDGIVVWCPNANPKNCWENKLWEQEHEDVFTEKYIGEPGEAPQSIQSTQDKNTQRYLNEPLVRITFFKERDTDYYRFLGIYVLNIAETRKRNILVWHRVSMRLTLPVSPQIQDLLKLYINATYCK